MKAVSPDLDSERYWLDHCRGYQVQARNGRVGTVEDVVPWMDALEVRAGRAGTRILLVPFDDIALIDPHEHRIVLHTSPHLLGTRTRERSLIARAPT